MEKTQQSNILVRGDQWLLQQSYMNGTYYLQKKFLRSQKRKVAELYYEQELIQKLQLHMMLEPTSIEQDEQFVTMNYEVKETHIPLTQLLGKPLPLNTFLKLAISLTNCFIELHQVSHIYQNFHPQHVLVNKQHNTIKLINFERTFKHSYRHVKLQLDNEFPKYRMLYMAPEETGRVNSGLDFQTDLYALGVIFYEMLSGYQVYEGQDEALINQMLTKEPKSFSHLGIEVPAIIEKIVVKLLCKNKEDRYQSAIGLKEDLMACWYKLTNQMALTDFPLARSDERGKWQLSEMSPVSKRVVELLIQSAKDGQSIQAVVGPKSSGKTYILSHIHQHFYHESQSSYMIAPQVGDNTLNIPVIFLALRHKIQQLIQSNQVEQLKHQSSWPSFIPNSIIYFLPELRTLQSHLRFSNEQEYIEQQQIFQVLVQLTEYLNVENVQTLFIVDDYGQLDDFTQQFLQFMMTQYSDKRFIYSGESLTKMEALFHEVHITEVKIAHLSQGDIFDWLSTSVKNDGDALKQCAKLLHDVTNGIPLYIHTFFNDICELQILKYSVQERRWHFDVTKIHTLDLRNYNEFIHETLAHLTAEQRLVVQYAVCLGARFDVVQLFEIVPYDYAKTLALFIQLVEKRVFIISQEQFSMLELIVDLNMLQEFDMYVHFFNDDMLQQAKGMLTDAQTQQVHRTIVDYLSKLELETTEQKRRLLYHLKLIELSLTDDQLYTYLTISLELGNMTLKNGVFHEALLFSRVFEHNMPVSYWTQHYEVAMNGYILHANALYLNNETAKAQPYFEFVLQKAKTIEDKLTVYNQTILFMTFSQVELPLQGHLKYIINLADEALGLVDMNLPKKYLTTAIAKEYTVLKLMLKNKSDEQLMNLPKIKDQRLDLILQILMHVCGVALIVDEKLFVWIIMRAIRMIAKHGDAVYASFFYGGYANILSTAFQDFENAFRFGHLSIEHLEKYDNILFKGNVYMNFGGSISYLKNPYHRSIYYLHQTQHYSIPNSLHDLYNATAATYIMIYMMLQGSNIADVKREYEEQWKYFATTNNPIAQVYATELMNWLNVLQNESSRIDWDYQVENQTRVSYWESHLSLRLQMGYLLCEQDETMKILGELKSVVKDSTIRPERPVMYYYEVLALFRELDSTISGAKKHQLLKDIKTCIKKLRKFAACGPVNYEHLLMLMEAMKLAYTQQTDKAMLYFDRAIQLARLANNSRDEAIAQLNAAQFYYSLGEQGKASNYMQRALELLYHWGAPYVVNIWSVKFHYLLKQEHVFEDEHATKPFNIAPIVSMYQMIAQEADEAKLAKTALQEMMTHLDANQIYLLKVKGNTCYPIASANSDTDVFHYYDEIYASLPAIIDHQLVDEVLATKSYVIQNDVNAKQKSVIALSIFNKGQITAIVYATNYVLSSIFTKSKIDIVTILATQFLIALENIERQQQLELEVANRTEQLSQLNDQLQEMNAQLLQSEQERKYFLQHISHDLRSPLTSIIGYVEALESGMVQSEEKQLQYLQRSKVRLLSLQHLIKDLFDLTQLEGGRLDFQFERIKLRQFLALIEEKLQQELMTDQLKFESNFMLDHDEGYVLADMDRMTQVVQNLTSNILKYANNGVVHAHFIVKNEVLSIIISDQGIGIPTKDIPFIFDMHYTASNHRQREAHGIGMAICKRIIELHEGKIDVTSTEGKGTTFTIELPIV